MKKMFTLRGVSNCGKSSKVKDIANWILANYPHAINHGIDFTKGDISGVLEVNKVKIGFVAAGDDLSCVLGNDYILDVHNDIDIIINSCRTKGNPRKHLEVNYNFSTGWLVKNIFVTKYEPSNPSIESIRDLKIMEELKSWLTGLEKL
ncbi:hypothetical protein [Flavobacterium johnsoniae]|uniref:hypothetical protein n=1 Tax=Flavobacterium johnsoniae TaxID=986 RepID=UPI003D966DF3